MCTWSLLYSVRQHLVTTVQCYAVPGYYCTVLGSTWSILCSVMEYLVLLYSVRQHLVTTVQCYAVLGYYCTVLGSTWLLLYSVRQHLVTTVKC
jgi:hypothetical protein